MVISKQYQSKYLNLLLFKIFNIILKIINKYLKRLNTIIVSVTIYFKKVIIISIYRFYRIIKRLE